MPLRWLALAAVAIPLAARGSSAASEGTTTVSTTAARTTTTEAVPTTAKPTTTAAPTTVATTLAPTTVATAPPTTVPPVVVTGIVDGETLDLSTGERVRIIGIDTPEAGQCGYDSAAARLGQLALGQPVTVNAGARDDADRYGRLLRCVDVNGVDAGLQMVNEGLAIARYDSRDGYGHHAREEAYVAADAASPSAHICAPAAPAGDGRPRPAQGGGSAYYANCDAARAAGAAPLYAGDPGCRAKLDRDKDGVACE